MVKAVLTKKRLIISIPLHKPKPSKSGKTLVVATTHGFKSSQVTLSGKRIRVNAIACIFSDNPTKSSEKVAKKHPGKDS
jgi:hypothetical protein